MKEYRFKINGKDYTVAVNGIQANVADVTVNGIQYDVELEDAPAVPAGNRATLGILRGGTTQQSGVVGPERSEGVSSGNAGSGNGKAQTVKSPLPGVIIEISVKEGQTVKAGQKVAVLEAMKMENEIQASADGTVTEIHVQTGNSVLEGAEIVTIA